MAVATVRPSTLKESIQSSSQYVLRVFACERMTYFFEEPRKAETLLPHFCPGHTPDLHQVVSFLNTKRRRCECVPNVKKDCEHVLLMCSSSKQSPRDLVQGQKDKNQTNLRRPTFRATKGPAVLTKRGISQVDHDCVRNKNTISTPKKKKKRKYIETLLL